MQDTSLMNDNYGNGPLVAMTFMVGLGAFSLTGMLSSVLVAVLVGLLGKAVDVGLRWLIARRESYWRREARRLQRELGNIRRSDQPTPTTDLNDPHAGET
jgi:hypothetical protein